MSINQKDFETFRIRFGSLLSKRGLSCNEVAKDSVAKEYIFKYVKENVTDKETEHRILGLTYTLANMRIAKYALTVERAHIDFPIINIYKEKQLQGSIFFEKVDGQINGVYEPVSTKPIIVV